MVLNKLATIKALINFFNKYYNFKFENLDVKIDNIIQSTDFKLLKENENNYGFDESVNDNFFWKGTINQ